VVVQSWVDVLHEAARYSISELAWCGGSAAVCWPSIRDSVAAGELFHNTQK